MMEDQEMMESKPKAIRQELESKMNPADQKAYEKVVLAGLKIMFSPETHEQAIKHIMQSEGDIPQKLANGVADLLGMLYEQSKGSLPPNVVFPAAMAFLTHALEYMEMAGEDTEGILPDAVMVLFPTVMKKFGMSDEEIMQAFSGGFNNQQIQPQAQGLIEGAMQ